MGMAFEMESWARLVWILEIIDQCLPGHVHGGMLLLLLWV
jgi:hypothetical protein